jgi:hypothetical protein
MYAFNREENNSLLYLHGMSLLAERRGIAQVYQDGLHHPHGLAANARF